MTVPDNFQELKAEELFKQDPIYEELTYEHESLVKLLQETDLFIDKITYEQNEINKAIENHLNNKDSDGDEDSHHLESHARNYPSVSHDVSEPNSCHNQTSSGVKVSKRNLSQIEENCDTEGVLRDRNRFYNLEILDDVERINSQALDLDLKFD